MKNIKKISKAIIDPKDPKVIKALKVTRQAQIKNIKLGKISSGKLTEKPMSY